VTQLSETENYAALEHLRNGTPVEIRALRPADEADMLAAIEQTSPQSLQRRFFAMKRNFSERELAFFMEVDFSNHVALVVLAQENDRQMIVGGGRYVVFESDRAEMAFVVVDAWQGRGIGTLLMRHLITIARHSGLRELTAEVLPENTAMLKVFERSGFKPTARRDPHTIHLVLQID
jgi:RimJ/RimL family protein N-acetyltransferase